MRDHTDALAILLEKSGTNSTCSNIGIWTIHEDVTDLESTVTQKRQVFGAWDSLNKKLRTKGATISRIETIFIWDADLTLRARMA